jgi:colanic acid biosynthesis glycosyl transferase WcaI
VTERLILVNRYFHPDESATSQLLSDLAQHLGANRNVLVLTSRQLLENPKARLPAEDRLPAAAGSIRIQRLWSTSSGRAWLPGRLLDYLSFLASVVLWLLLHARSRDVVLAKTDPPLLGVATTLATVGRGTRHVQWLQDLYPETAARLGVVAEGTLTTVARALRDWSLRRSTLVVTVSAGMREYLRNRVGAAQLVHLPNWADDHAPPVDGRLAPPVGTPRSQAPLVVGYSGNLGRGHPIEALMQLAERVDPAVHFLFTGGGAHQQRLREHVQRLGRPNWTFLPYQPRQHLGELLQRADLHLVLLDPRAEGFMFPSKVYGILSAGRPILHLGDPAGEVAQLVREHDCGWSLAPGSGAAIPAFLDDLRADRAQIAAAGRRARLAYERHYSRSNALARWRAALGAVFPETV